MTSFETEVYLYVNCFLDEKISKYQNVVMLTNKSIGKVIFVISQEVHIIDDKVY